MAAVDFQQRIERQFDSFCRTVLKNTLRTLLAQRRRKISYELPLDIDTLQIVIEPYESIHPLHAHKLDQWTAALMEDIVADAIMSLSEDQRRIILLYYFLGRSDYEIADELNMVRRTVSRHRNRALSSLRDFLGKEMAYE